LQYLLKWKGYPEAENTWENKEDVFVQELLEEFHQQHPMAIRLICLQKDDSNSSHNVDQPMSLHTLSPPSPHRHPLTMSGNAASALASPVSTRGGNHGGSEVGECLLPLTLPQAILVLALPPNTSREELEEAWSREERQAIAPITEAETVRRIQEREEREAGEEVSPVEGNPGTSDNPFIVDTPSGMPAIPVNHPGEPWIQYCGGWTDMEIQEPGEEPKQAEYLRFDIVDDKPTITGTMGRGLPHHTGPLYAAPCY